MCFFSYRFRFDQVILVLRNLAWTEEHVDLLMEMLDINVYVHQVIQEVDVKSEMHVKVILAWMEEPANLSMEIVDINVYVPLVIVVHDVKQVCLHIDKQISLLLCR